MNKEMTPYEHWFTTCMLFSLRTYIAPDEYVWDLKDEYWLTRFDTCSPPIEAVAFAFPEQFKEKMKYDKLGRCVVSIEGMNESDVNSLIQDAFGYNFKMCTITKQ